MIVLEASCQDQDKISHIVKWWFKQNTRNQKGITNKYYTWRVLVKKKRCQNFEPWSKNRSFFGTSWIWNHQTTGNDVTKTGKCHGKSWWDGFGPTVIHAFLQTYRVSSFILGVFWLKLSPLGHDDSPYRNLPCGVKQNHSNNQPTNTWFRWSSLCCSQFGFWYNSNQCVSIL